VHAETYKCYNYCKLLYETCLCLEGQEEYDDFELKLAHSFDLEDACKTEELENLLISSKYFKNRPVAKELPGLSPFPMWEIEKESKMYLTELDPPNLDMINSFRDRARLFLTKYCPTTLPLPDGMQEYKLGTTIYNDSGTKRRDSERPEFSHHCPFAMQRFMTGPLVSREVWLPSKAYKCNSTWWHLFTAPIFNKLDHVVGNDHLEDICLSVSRRFRPCKSIDLKGCGLQYPREYLIIIMEILSEMYPHDIVKEHLDLAKTLLSQICIQELDNTFVYPKRGVGLGYYSNLMTLASAIMLEGCYIVKMFNDDIYVSATDFNKAVASLTSFGMILNEEKTGKDWYTCLHFAGFTIFPGEKPQLQEYSSHSSILASIFSQKYHWQRKQLVSSVNIEEVPYIAYHYERIFGYEFRAGESMLHPINQGCNVLYPKLMGVRDDRKIPQMQKDLELVEISTGIPFHKFNKEEAKDLHVRRRHAWKHRKFINTSLLDVVDPIIENRSTKKMKQSIAASSIPMWAERNAVIYHHVTTGKMSCGLFGSALNKAIQDCRFSSRPYYSYATGGYDIITPWYINRPAYDERVQEHEVLIMSQENQPTLIERVDLSSDDPYDPEEWNLDYVTDPQHSLRDTYEYVDASDIVTTNIVDDYRDDEDILHQLFDSDDKLTFEQPSTHCVGDEDYVGDEFIEDIDDISL